MYRSLISQTIRSGPMFSTGKVVDLHAPSDTGSTMLGTDDIGDADESRKMFQPALKGRMGPPTPVALYCDPSTRSLIHFLRESYVLPPSS